MNKEEFKRRTKRFALEVTRLTGELPRGRVTEVIGRQLLKAGTSVGANYRAACRGKSPADFAAKMGIVEEEADETAYWLELLVKSGIATLERVGLLLKEADELTRLSVASIKTARETQRAAEVSRSRR